MKSCTLAARVSCLGLCLALTPSTTKAWEVSCVDALGQKCPDTFAEAQTPWRLSPNSEHPALLARSLTLSGLPATLLDAFELTVYTGDEILTGLGGATYGTIRPVFLEARRERTREISIPGMASLPDFSYTLWDWSAGNETCPPNPANPNALDCHNYNTHIGWLNSNHMLPQSRGWYEHLHALALERAAVCKAAFFATPPGLRERYDPYLRGCERLALVLEGVGHHYLQDSWSTGHMWERWGGSQISDFVGDRALGFAVAAFSGTVHGAKKMLEETPPFNRARWDDPLCAPHPDVSYLDGADTNHGVGDLFMSRLLGQNDEFAPQRKALLGCAVDSLRAVYEQTAQVHGPMVDATIEELDISRSVRDGSCWDQRMTNRAMAAGFGIHIGETPNQRRVSEQIIVIAGVTEILPWAAGAPSLDDATKRSFKRDAAYATALALAKGADPSTADHTDIASGGLPALAGIWPNGVYARGNAQRKVLPALHADPFLPWRLKVDDPSTQSLLLTFADATAVDRCSELTTADLEAARASVAQARDSGASDEVVQARVGQCVQLVAPHFRHGVEGNYDVRREAFCAGVAPAAQAYAYSDENSESFSSQDPVDEASLRASVKSWCRHDPPRTDCNIEVTRVCVQGGFNNLSPCGQIQTGPFPVRPCRDVRDSNESLIFGTYQNTATCMVNASTTATMDFGASLNLLPEGGFEGSVSITNRDVQGIFDYEIQFNRSGCEPVLELGADCAKPGPVPFAGVRFGSAGMMEELLTFGRVQDLTPVPPSASYRCTFRVIPPPQ